ncbi:Cilia- and flagella-associated protein 251, partial [Borealophlyctis nickersoniae]
VVQVWDFSNKRVVVSRRFEEERVVVDDGRAVGKKKKEVPPEPLRVQCMAFSPSGKTLALGFTNGTIRIVSPDTLLDLPQATPASHRPGVPGYAISHSPITHVTFAPDNEHMAASDADHAVAIFRREIPPATHGSDPKIKRDVEWVFIGRCRAHYGEIVGVVFVPPPLVGEGEKAPPRLVSVAMDRHAAEYDVGKSSVAGGVVLKELRRLEQTYRPLCALLLPKGRPEQGEQFLLTTNTGYKLRTYNAATLLCRRTSLGPTYAGFLTHLAVAPGEGEAKYIFYRTAEKVVGVIKTPLDGNPHRAMGLIAHPGQVSNLAPTANGAYLLTAGGSDGVVNMWSFTPSTLEAQFAMAATGLEPFLNMVDPSGAGERGEFYREMEDYFYYAQLRSQGEDATKNRQIQETVGLEEAPPIMQAMGYYPSAQEIEDMINEVKYSKWDDGRGHLSSTVTFEDLIRLYVNHRPVSDYTQSDLEGALSHALRLEPGNPPPRGPAPPLKPTDAVSKHGLMALLQQYGETLAVDEFAESFRTLLRDEAPYNGKLPDRFSAREFVEDVLGLLPTVGGGPEKRAESAREPGGEMAQ